MPKLIVHINHLEIGSMRAKLYFRQLDNLCKEHKDDVIIVATKYPHGNQRIRVYSPTIDDENNKSINITESVYSSTNKLEQTISEMQQRHNLTEHFAFIEANLGKPAHVEITTGAIEHINLLQQIDSKTELTLFTETNSIINQRDELLNPLAINADIILTKDVINKIKAICSGMHLAEKDKTRNVSDGHDDRDDDSTSKMSALLNHHMDKRLPSREKVDEAAMLPDLIEKIHVKHEAASVYTASTTEDSDDQDDDSTSKMSALLNHHIDKSPTSVEKIDESAILPDLIAKLHDKHDVASVYTASTAEDSDDLSSDDSDKQLTVYRDPEYSGTKNHRARGLWPTFFICQKNNAVLPQEQNRLFLQR